MDNKKYCPIYGLALTIFATNGKKLTQEEIDNTTECSSCCAWYDDAYQRCSIKSLAVSSEHISYK
jgi:hypothetical protein